MIQYIERSIIEDALNSARNKLRKHENRPLSEACIEAKTCIQCFEYILLNCKDVPPTQLKFTSSPWHRDPSWKYFQYGTMQGLYKEAAGEFELLSIINNTPGNGHFQKLLNFFYDRCSVARKNLRIREVDSLKDLLNEIGIEAKGISQHLLKEGFSYAEGDDMIKYFK